MNKLGNFLIIVERINIILFLFDFSLGKTTELPHEALTALAMIEDLGLKMAISRETLSTYVPPAILNSHH